MDFWKPLDALIIGEDPWIDTTIMYNELHIPTRV